MCHLKTDELPCPFSSACFVSKLMESSCACEHARETKGSGELAGENDSKQNDEHSGSGSKGIMGGESESSVEDFVSICRAFEGTGNLSRGGDKSPGKETTVEVLMGVDFIGLQGWVLGNNGASSGTDASEPFSSASEMDVKTDVLDSF